MFPNNKIIEIFSICDDFSKVFDKTLEQKAIPNCDSSKKRKYHRDGMMSDSEVMTILILFHDSGYRCLKHFYLEKVCKHMRHLYLSILCLFVSITYKMITRLTSKETLTYTLAVISSPALYEYPSSGGGIVEGCGARIFSEIHR